MHIYNMEIQTAFKMFNEEGEPRFVEGACFGELKDLVLHTYDEITKVHYYPYIHQSVENQFNKSLKESYIDVVKEYYADIMDTNLSDICSMSESMKESGPIVIDPDDCDSSSSIREAFEGEHDEDNYVEVQVKDVPFSKVLLTLKMFRIAQEKPHKLSVYYVAKRSGMSAREAIIASFFFQTEDPKKAIKDFSMLDETCLCSHSPMSCVPDFNKIIEFYNTGNFPEGSDSSEPIFITSGQGEFFPNSIQEMQEMLEEQVPRRLIAVYGTLRKREANHGVLGDARRRAGIALVKLPMKMVNLGAFPALIPSDTVNDIIFEIYEVNKEQYRSVEILEGYPNLYDKFTFIWNGSTVEAYFMHKAEGDVIPTGDWKNRRA